MYLKNDQKKKKGLGNEVVEEIKKSDVRMKPPCYFMFISFVWICLGAILFLISLILLALGVHYLSEYEFVGLIGKGYFSGWFFVPFLIMLFSVLLLYFSSRLYRKGRICCRHEEWMLLLAIGVVTILGLFVLASSDVLKGGRDFIKNHCVKKGMIVSTEGFWSNSQKGRLSGEVIGIDRDKKYILIENGDDLWKVYTGNCGCEINHENAKKGDYIKLIGEIDNREFQAEEIWDWK
jgi:hypothetical protein